MTRDELERKIDQIVRDVGSAYAGPLPWQERKDRIMALIDKYSEDEYNRGYVDGIDDGPSLVGGFLND